MDNKWNFKIDLIDDSVFNELQEYYGVAVPDDLKNFIIKANASNPEKSLVVINGEERVLETILSFNKTEDEALTVFDIIKSVKNNTAVPFGMDPFGNIFYCSLVDSKVLFFNHEEGTYENSNCTLVQFVSNLYC